VPDLGVRDVVGTLLRAECIQYIEAIIMEIEINLSDEVYKRKKNWSKHLLTSKFIHSNGAARDQRQEDLAPCQ